MRIAFFVLDFPTLSETFILNQITDLIDRGHEIDIYAQGQSRDQIQHPEVEQYGLLQRTGYRSTTSRPMARASNVMRLFGQGAKKWPKNLRALNFVKHGRPAATGRLLEEAAPLVNRGCPSYDVIHAHFAQRGVPAVQLREIGAIQGPLLTTFHGLDVNCGDPGILRRRYRRLFKWGNRFTANTNFTAGRAAALGCPPERIVKLPVGITTARYRFATRQHAQGKPIRLLSVARLTEKKGLEYGIRAVAELRRTHPHIEYRIVGEGKLRGQLEQLIRELGLSDCVHLLGARAQDEISGLYHESHLFMLPSVTAANGDMEGQGLVLQEAQATGMPVISTHHNGIPEGVRDGITGVLVPERDSHALADALRNLINHSERWPEMGRAGRALVEAEFESSRLNDRLIEIYEELAAAG